VAFLASIQFYQLVGVTTKQNDLLPNDAPTIVSDDKAQARAWERKSGAQLSSSKVSAENLVENKFIDNNIFSTALAYEEERHVSCDSSPCNGFFAYDAPSKDKNASLHILQTAVAAYHYFPERNSDAKNKLIFMPNITNHPSCVQEWKESRPKWHSRYVIFVNIKHFYFLRTFFAPVFESHNTHMPFIIV
jgi:hypothetical protein